MQIIDIIFLVVIIVFSSIIHEVMHGIAADYLGDKTARYAGRLTLNPIPHIDPFGSVILPLVFALSGSPIFFGWAKPVPYNPYNLRPGRFSEAIVAGAGPASNALIAIVCGLLVRSGIFGAAGSAIFLICAVNVMLCIFNLIPVPPLDGSKVLESLLWGKAQYAYAQMRRGLDANPILGMGLVLLLVIFLGGAFGNAIYAIASAIAGQ